MGKTQNANPTATIVCVPARNDDESGTWHIISRDRSARHSLDSLTFATYAEAVAALRGVQS